MGRHDLSTGHLKEAALQGKHGILVVASSPYVAVLEQAGGMGAIPGLRAAALPRGAAVPADVLGDAAILVIEVDPADTGSMSRLGDVRDACPDLSVVAAIADASVSLVRTLLREGISDVVALPFEHEDLLQISLEAAAKRGAETAGDAALSPVIAVTRAIGGCGATTLVTHLASELAAQDPGGRGAVIVDLDLQFGSVADFLGVNPRGTVADLLGAGERLDEELMRSVATDAGGGVAVIAAPEAIMPLESVDTDALLRMIRLLRQHYDQVLLDLPANWTNWALSSALAADSIVLVVEMSIASLRQAKRRLELFRSVGIPDRAVEIVVNRVEKRLFRTIGLSDVADALGRPVRASVALDAPLVGAAQDQGQLVTQMHRKRDFSKNISQLAQLFHSEILTRTP